MRKKTNGLKLAIIALAALLAACNTVPSTNIRQPGRSRRRPAPPAPA